MDTSGGAPEDPNVPEGAVIGDYKVVRVIGAGSFGTVYEGLHPLIGKRVAIKVLARKYSSDSEAVSRFIAEARVVNEIRHRNIVDIFSFNQLPDGRQYFVMEFLDGPTLEGYLDQHGKVAPVDAVPLLREIASALDAAHRMGVAHRDVKPANIMITTNDGRPAAKLIDFGLAKLTTPEADQAHHTRTGAIMGTPKYMAPEQCRSKPADHRSDIYAFGLIAYEMLAGSPPFDGKDSFDYMMHHTNSTPRAPSELNPQLPAAFNRAILATLEKDPEKRPSELMPVADTLASFAEDAPAGKWRGLPRWMPWAAAFLLTTAAGYGLWRVEMKGGPELPAKAVVVGPIEPTPVPPPMPPPPAPPARVALRLEGTPGMLAYGPDGALLGMAPDTIRLERGKSAIQLRLIKDGYQEESRPITPSADQTLRVDLKKKQGAPQAKKRPEIEVPEL